MLAPMCCAVWFLRGKLISLYHLFKMSDSGNDLLSSIAARCNIRDEKVIRKSKELLALLNSKQKLNYSDTCKAVVCLELASSLTSSLLSRDEAIKYSGCKKKIYINIYNIISKLLNLDKIYSVKEICLLAGIIDVHEPATKLLEAYKSSCEEIDCDFDHPIYPCAAVFAYCRNKKIKSNFPKLVEISRVKKAELDGLAKKFQALIETKKEDSKKPLQKSKRILKTKITELNNEEYGPSPRKQKSTSSVMSDEEYEAWKRKMLED